MQAMASMVEQTLPFLGTPAAVRRRWAGGKTAWTEVMHYIFRYDGCPTTADNAPGEGESPTRERKDWRSLLKNAATASAGGMCGAQHRARGKPLGSPLIPFMGLGPQAPKVRLRTKAGREDSAGFTSVFRRTARAARSARFVAGCTLQRRAEPCA